MDAWTIEPYGSRAWLVRFGDELSAGVLAHAVAVARALEASPPAGLREFTMGYATVLLEFGVEIEEERVREIADVLQSLPARRMHAAPRRVDIPVVYDGEDLPAVARHTGMDEAEVIRRHSGRDYQVWLLGFAPGFAYLGVVDAALHMPRRAVPRPRIAAGSVAIAGLQTGVYPSDSAGGWQVIGRTARRMFDPGNAADPFLLHPGDTVRFTVVAAGDV